LISISNRNEIKETQAGVGNLRTQGIRCGLPEQ
jgi:hypothetical protein